MPAAPSPRQRAAEAPGPPVGSRAAEAPDPHAARGAGEAPAPGVYVHVPFCAHRCGYCNFAVDVGADAGLRRRYTDGVLAHLAAVAEAGPRALAPQTHHGGEAPGPGWPVLGSVFVGGGTPTLLDPGDLARLLTGLVEALPLAADAEVTVEANPETVDEASLATLAAAGCTRVSIGAQAFEPATLAFLDRRHDPEAPARAAADARRAGLASVSLDLIYGVPGQTPEQWEAGLDAALEAGVDHLSCYALTLERNTPYARAVALDGVPAPDDDVAAARMAAAGQRLRRAGLRRYEVSNWARPGHESAHNRMYWRGGDYLALGAAAHGHWQGRRWWNLRPTQRYLARVEAGQAPTGGQEILDEATRRAERLLLGLRTAEGVARAEVTPIDEEAAAALVAGGLLADDGAVLRVTEAGWALADGLAVRLLP